MLIFRLVKRLNVNFGIKCRLACRGRSASTSAVAWRSRSRGTASRLLPVHRYRSCRLLTAGMLSDTAMWRSSRRHRSHTRCGPTRLHLMRRWWNTSSRSRRFYHRAPLSRRTKPLKMTSTCSRPCVRAVERRSPTTALGPAVRTRSSFARRRRRRTRPSTSTSPSTPTSASIACTPSTAVHRSSPRRLPSTPTRRARLPRFSCSSALAEYARTRARRCLGAHTSNCSHSARPAAPACRASRRRVPPLRTASARPFLIGCCRRTATPSAALHSATRSRS